MSNETVESIIAICAVFFMMAFAAILYVVYRKLEEIESHLTRNTIVVNTKKTWGHAGYFGKLMRLAMIIASLMFAPYWSRRKLLDLKEIEFFPRNLKYWAYIPFASSILLMFLMTVLLRYIGRI